MLVAKLSADDAAMNGPKADFCDRLARADGALTVVGRPTHVQSASSTQRHLSAVDEEWRVLVFEMQIRRGCSRVPEAIARNEIPCSTDIP